MKKITIGLFNDSFPPMVDGVGMVVDNYARRLCKYANVVVLVPGYKGEYDDSIYPYKVIRCRSIKMPFVDYSLPLPLVDNAFRREVQMYSFDIIHIHSPFSIGRFGIELAKKRNIPVIGTMHSQYQQDFQRAVSNDLIVHELTRDIVRVYDHCTKCFAVNSGMANLYYQDYGVKEMPGVLSNATEMKYVEDGTSARERINTLYGLNDSDKVFLFVGRINKLKNILFIIDSLEILNQKKLTYQYKMLFVGHGQDYEELKVICSYFHHYMMLPVLFRLRLLLKKSQLFS